MGDEEKVHDETFHIKNTNSLFSELAITTKNVNGGVKNRVASTQVPLHSIAPLKQPLTMIEKMQLMPRIIGHAVPDVQDWWSDLNSEGIDR